MKFSRCFLVFTCIFSFYFVQPKKHVIGSRRAGFFSNFFAVLNHLAYCENKAQPVVWWVKTTDPYYQSQGYNGSKNVWEYYFESVSNACFTSGDRIHYNYIPPDKKAICVQGNPGLKNRLLVNALIEKYIRVKENIQEKVDTFFQLNMKNAYVIGIHLRGTDKAREVKSVPPSVIFKAANIYAQKVEHSNIKFFVATDEERFIALAKKELQYPIIFYNSYRSLDNRPVHLAVNSNRKNHCALLGEEILIEALLLSHCNYFIHTQSNVSSAVLYFNPYLSNLMLKA